jgi:hypothetical protein
MSVYDLDEFLDLALDPGISTLRFFLDKDFLEVRLIFQTIISNELNNFTSNFLSSLRVQSQTFLCSNQKIYHDLKIHNLEQFAEFALS